MCGSWRIPIHTGAMALEATSPPGVPGSIRLHAPGAWWGKSGDGGAGWGELPEHPGDSIRDLVHMQREGHMAPIDP